MRRGWSSRPAAASAALLAVAALACGSLSVPEERALGEEFLYEAKRHLVLFSEPVVVGYVESLGRDILRAAGPQPFDYRFFVVEDHEINAFAGPAGHVFVNTGTILKARNVSELAGVLAHEIGHVALRHVAENYERQRTASTLHRLGVYTAAILGGQIAAGAANLGGGLATLAVLNSFGREAEREADAFALEILPRAGIHPVGLVAFLALLSREGGAGVPGFLASHPAPEDRLEDAREKIEDLDLAPHLRTEDGGRLEIIQQRIRLLTR